MIETIYYISLSVIIVAAIVVAASEAIPGGFVGATVWGAVAVSAVAGFDQEPTRWTTSLVASLAGAAVWAATRWRMHRTRCLLDHLTKVGGTD